MPILVPSSPRMHDSPTSPYVTGRPSSDSSPTIHPYSPSLRPSINHRASLDAVSLFRLDERDGDFSGDEGAGEGEGWEDPDGVSVEGVKHVELDLEAKQYQTPAFHSDVLLLLRRLRIIHWCSRDMRPSNLKIVKVSGALTNSVFFVSYQPTPEGAGTPDEGPHAPQRGFSTSSAVEASTSSSWSSAGGSPYRATGNLWDAPTLLLRIYGSTSSTFISRPTELRTLHLLSSIYHLGPALLGTFLNGRIEQFFASRALTATELRQPETSRWIARRMAELHTADMELLGPHSKGLRGETRDPTVLTSIRDWAGPAREIVMTLAKLERDGDGAEELKEGAVGMKALKGWVKEFDMDKLELEIAAYTKWLKRYEEGEVMGGKKWKMVFAHNDAQYGNLLRLDSPPKPPAPPHHAIIVVDFEYAAPNPLVHDIANHFNEWLADYHHDTLSHSMSHKHMPYPNKDERWNFYRAYWDVSRGGTTPKEEELEELDRGVRAWSPIGSAAWALWGVVSARSQVEAVQKGDEEYAPEFEYLLYALERVKMFRDNLWSLGITI
ncbi:kinase-like domain-containing protein [Mrakia frigida]|uniref:kinase-like domain-containing protein n=1 Tax=Mrakia frigida TaxID=29902 RepID=UPI003FCBFBF6